MSSNNPIHIPDLDDWEYYSISILVVVLVLIGGLVAGLTIGLMSIDATNLAILKVSGTASEKKAAAAIEPIRKNGHLLLVTLLLVNTVVNETLPILFDALEFHGLASVLISTALIVVFGEILPQAVCSRYGLQIGALFAVPVRILIFLLSFLAWPIAKLLDWLLGHKEGNIYRHAGLKELVALHGEDQSGPLSKDEVSILRAVLDLRTKTVRDVMTSLDDVFMFSVSQKLDMKTCEQIIRAGHSRIPIYLGNDRNAILGTLLVKQLLLIDPEDEMPLSSLKLRKLPRVCSDTPLFDMLHVFEAGASHMALIIDELSTNTTSGSLESPKWIARSDSSRLNCLGIITLEDVIEELIGEEIIDETDVYVDMQSKTRVARRHNNSVTREDSLNIFSSNENIAVQSPEFDSDNDECEHNENQPLLSKPVNPNSALAYRSIKLPSSSLMPASPKQSRPDKKTKKTLFTAHELTSDLYSTGSPSEGTPYQFALQDADASLPELQLTNASLDLEKGAPSKSL